MPGMESARNIHPMFVHFPIALTLTAFLMVVIHLLTRSAEWIRMATVLIYLSAAAALVTVITGYQASGSLGHDTQGHDLVHVHRDIMLAYTVLIVLLAIVHGLARSEIRPWLAHWSVRVIRLVLLIAATATLIIGTDRGAELVFGKGMGMRLQSIAGADESGEMEEPVENEAPEHKDDHVH